MTKRSPVTTAPVRSRVARSGRRITNTSLTFRRKTFSRFGNNILFGVVRKSIYRRGGGCSGEAAPEGPAPEEATAAEGIATAEEAAEEAVVHEQD